MTDQLDGPADDLGPRVSASSQVAESDLSVPEAALRVPTQLCATELLA